MNSKNIKGIIAYPITPFTKDEKVDVPLFKVMVERLILSGVHGIAPLGSTGVLPYLKDEEKEEITEATVKQVNERLPVVVGVSNLTTERTIYHAKFAEKAGATALMIIPMSYWRLCDEEIIRHYDKVASAVSIPIMAYNNPATGGLDMSPNLLKKLLQIPNVTMIKESSGDVQRMHFLKKEIGEEVSIFNGSNPLALAAFAAGAKGWCTAAPNLIPELTLSLYEAVIQNDFERARTIFYHQFNLLKFIVNTGLPRSIKAGMEILGKNAGELRCPLISLSEKEKQELEILLQNCCKPVNAEVVF